MRPTAPSSQNRPRILSALPVVRDAGARALFLPTALISITLLAWLYWLGANDDPRGLTPIYFVLFQQFDYPAAMCALLILVCAALVPSRVRLRPVLRWVGAHPCTVAAASAILLCAGSLIAYSNHPFAMDEYAQFFQSQVFATGHLAGRFPTPLLDWLIPKDFQNHFLFVSKSTGAVASAYWPSFALLLTPFTWLGIPWACNPIISALTVIAVHRLALRLFDDHEAAGLAALLTAASPVFFANGISYYSMPAHMLANTVYVLLLTAPTPRRAFSAGVVGSIALTLHNPVPHILFAIPWLVWVANRPRALRLVGCLAAGYVPLCVLLGVGWFLFTIDLRQAALDAATSASTQLHNVARLAGVFSLPDASLLFARLIGLAKVWIWAVPALVIAAAAGAWKWRSDPFCRLLLGSAVLTLIGFLFVPADQGHGWGFRYFHSAWMVLPLLAAGAFARKRGEQHIAPDGGSDDAVGFVTACALLSLAVAVPFRAVQIRDLIAHQLQQVPRCGPVPSCVVIIDPHSTFYGADLVQNDPFLRSGIIRMIGHGVAENEDMMREHFPLYQRDRLERHGEVWLPASDASARAASMHTEADVR